MATKQPRVLAPNITINEPPLGACLGTSGDIPVKVTVEGQFLIAFHAFIGDLTNPVHLLKLASPTPPLGSVSEIVPSNGGTASREVPVAKTATESECRTQAAAARNVLKVWLEIEEDPTYPTDSKYFYAHFIEFRSKPNGECSA